jgi:NodT family efflux transporter outer membrane factor (OMF) lipoprotein
MRYSLYLLSISILTTGCYNTCYQSTPLDLPFDAIERQMDFVSNDPIFEMSECFSEDWWTLFEDEQLSCFIHQTLAYNPTLLAAQSKIFAAQAEADKTLSVFLPLINLNGDIQREKISKTSPLIPTVGTPSTVQIPVSPRIPFYFTQYETYLNFSYDLDLWGKNRNTLQAAVGLVKAAEADEAMTRLALSISVANTYFQLQASYERRKIAQTLLKNREQYSELTQQRFQDNIDSVLSTLTVVNEVDAAKIDLIRLEALTSQLENQLRAYLANDFNDCIQTISIAEKEIPQVPIPQNLPLNLLMHRPDITAQLWIIESAGHRIDVAKAGFYPDVNLLGFIGFQSASLKKLLEGQSAFWDGEAAFSLPIFNNGLLNARLKSATIDYDLAIYEYNHRILNAVQEVLDEISQLHFAHQEFVQFHHNKENQEEIYRLTQLRVENNLNSSIDLLNAEQSMLKSRDLEVIAKAKTLLAILSLIKAIGGGY